VLQAHHLTVKKPGGGIAADQFDQLIGRRLAVDVHADQPLQAGMLAEGRQEAEARQVN
jgi:sialic acid synthase SpsE